MIPVFLSIFWAFSGFHELNCWSSGVLGCLFITIWAILDLSITPDWQCKDVSHNQ